LDDRPVAISAPSSLDDRSGLSEAAWIVRKAAFRAILETGQPWAAADAGTRLPLDDASVRAAVEQLVDAGRARTDADGRVTAAAGLSTDPTAHRIETAAGSRWTNCAYDALGIFGALGVDGRVDTRSPSSGASIHVRFEGGEPVGSDSVLFLADQPCCSRPNEDWCPNVNLFEDASSASAWAAEHGVAGRVVSLEQGTDLGTAEWRPLVDGLERRVRPHTRSSGDEEERAE
jgi:hypothetical protein